MLCQFFLLAKLNVVSQAGLQAGVKYNREVQQRGRGHGLGPPQTHVAAAVVDALESVSKEGAKDVLGKYKMLINSQAGRRAVTELFGCFKVKEAYSEDGTDDQHIKVKFTYQINPAADLEKITMTTKHVMDAMPSPQTLRRAMYATFLEQGAEESGGPAPKDELTRVTERQLKALQQVKR